jgi:hypothetical protein
MYPRTADCPILIAGKLPSPNALCLATRLSAPSGYYHQVQVVELRRSMTRTTSARDSRSKERKATLLTDDTVYSDQFACAPSLLLPSCDCNLQADLRSGQRSFTRPELIATRHANLASRRLQRHIKERHMMLWKGTLRRRCGAQCSHLVFPKHKVKATCG